MATTPQSVFDFGIMSIVSACFVYAVFIAFLVKAIRSVTRPVFHPRKSRLGITLQWLGLVLIAASVAISMPFMVLLSLYLSERFAMPYMMLPGNVAVIILIGGVALLVIGALVNFVYRRRAKT